MKILLYEFGFLLIVVIPVLLVMPVVSASLILCAPKWWAARAPQRLQDWLEGDSAFGRGVGRFGDAVTSSRIARPFALVGKTLATMCFGAVVLPFALIMLYIQTCVSVIEGACPYTHDTEWRDVLKKQWAFMTEPFVPSQWDPEQEASDG